MLFPVRVNFAIAALGLNPQVFKGDYRVGSQTIGKQQGHSPEEVALYMVSQLPAAYQVEMNVGTVRAWLRKRKINSSDPVVREAIRALDLEPLLGDG